MLKHIEIIQKMTDEQKLALAASVKSLALPEYAALGIPGVRHSGPNRVNAAMGNEFPPFQAAANSWDPDLLGDMAGAFARRAAADGINLLFMPKLRSKGAYTEGLTEDPLLTMHYAEKIIAATGNERVMPCAGVCSLSQTDADYADKTPDERALLEYYVMPFGNMQTDCPCSVSTDYTDLGGAYKGINTSTINRHLREWKYNQIICEGVDRDKYVNCLADGNIIWSGDVGVLRDAYRNYLKLKARVDSGESYIEELTKACQSGEALDAKTLDEAVDRVIEFAFSCHRWQNEGDRENVQYDAQLSARAAEESIVLLKNDGVLPLEKNSKVAVIGRLPCNVGSSSDLKLAEKIDESGEYVLAGTAAGYDIAGDRSDAMLEEALALAENADTVVLFMGTDKAREEVMRADRHSKLPANQLALADALSRTGKKVVAVVSSAFSADMSFDVNLSATLLAPTDGAHAYEALFNVISGKSNPSGKLAYTLYDDTDALFSRMKANKDGGKNKVGTFVGYRSYDASGEPVRYPFGYGLSYTEFVYSELKISGRTITFKVRNKGRVSGEEVAQIYIGAQKSSLARPVKELKDYVRISLAPGEEKTVSREIAEDSLAVIYSGKDVVERGIYNVYICSGVNDVRLSGNMQVGGVNLPHGLSDNIDYRLGESNILKGGYTLDKVKVVGDRGKKLRAASLFICKIAILGAGALIALDLSYIIGADIAQVGYVICGIAFVIGAIMLAVALVRIKNCRQTAVTVSEGVKVMQGEVKAAQPYELLFDKYFGEDDTEEEEDLPTENTEEERYIKYDSSMSLEEICAKLREFSARRGLSLEDKEVSEIIAAFCSSRLIIIQGQSPAVSRALVEVLSEFFCGGLYDEDAAKNYSSPRDFIIDVSDGAERRTAAAKAINDAQSRPDDVYIAALYGVTSAALSRFFAPFTKYVNYPDNGATVMLSEGGADERLYIPNNVWFVFTAAEGTDMSALDGTIADCACLLRAEGTITQKDDGVYEEGIVRTGQLEWVGKVYCADYALGEESSWKKIDKLEKFIGDRAGYSIPNKSWSAMEIYSSVLLACREEESAALDSTVAAKLLLPAFSRLGHQVNAEENGLIVAFEAIFGEGNMPECGKLIGTMSASVSSDAKGE